MKFILINFCLLILLLGCSIVVQVPQKDLGKFIAEENGKTRVHFKEVRGKLYDKILFFKFSPDSSRFAYIAKLEGKKIIVIDSTETEYKNIYQNSLTFSASGKRFVFVAKKNKKWFVVVDGKEETLIDNAFGFLSIRFSNDEKRVSYVARRDSKLFVVTDGKEDVMKCDNYSPPQLLMFSPDNSKFIYFGIRSSKWFIVINGKNSNLKVDGVLNHTPIFSSDGKRMAYGAKIGSNWHMVVDGKIGIKTDGFGEGSPIFSTTGDSIAYTALINKKWFLIVNDRIVKEINYKVERKRDRNAYEIWSLETLEEYFDINSNNKIPIVFCESPLALNKVNAFKIYYIPGYHFDPVEYQCKLKIGMNRILIENTGFFRKVRDIPYYEFYSDARHYEFYLNAQPGHTYVIRISENKENFLKYFSAENLLGKEKFIGIEDITKSYSPKE